jgi:preprotein translocase subunit SecE
MANKVVNYFQEAKTELKKVSWPTKKETTKHTLLVIGISLALAIFLGALDFLFATGFEKLITNR